MKAMNAKAIGGFLKGVRLARKMKPEHVSLKMSDLLGEPVSQATVYKIEGARMNVGLDRLMAIVAAVQADANAVVAMAFSGETAEQAQVWGQKSVEGINDVDWLRGLAPAEQSIIEAYLEENEG